VTPLRVLDTLSGQWSGFADLSSRCGTEEGELVVSDYPLIYEFE
jgi:hypothetical protein